MKYVALLRGINVGGNNKVSMAELKECFETLKFTNVSTYINSGNVIFETTQSVTCLQLQNQIEQALTKQFGFAIATNVISKTDYNKWIDNAPTWWGKDESSKHNAIFVIPPATTKQIMQEAGVAKPEYEQIHASGNVIFWTAPLATFSRTRWSKIVGTAAYKSVTIRNFNTAMKLKTLLNG